MKKGFYGWKFCKKCPGFERIRYVISARYFLYEKEFQDFVIAIENRRKVEVLQRRLSIFQFDVTRGIIKRKHFDRLIFNCTRVDTLFTWKITLTRIWLFDRIATINRGSPYLRFRRWCICTLICIRTEITKRWANLYTIFLSFFFHADFYSQQLFLVCL